MCKGGKEDGGNNESEHGEKKGGITHEPEKPGKPSSVKRSTQKAKKKQCFPWAAVFLTCGIKKEGHEVKRESAPCVRKRTYGLKVHAIEADHEGFSQEAKRKVQSGPES